MGLFVPLDVDYQLDPKIIAAGALAECLYIRSIAMAKRTMSDGLIDRTQLPSLALGIPAEAEQLASQLVAARLWKPSRTGWKIVAWLKHNPSVATVKAQQEIASENGTIGNHLRHHVEKGVLSPKCKHCVSDRVNGRHADRGGDRGGESGLVAKTETETEESRDTGESQAQEKPETQAETQSSSSRGDSGKAHLTLVDDDEERLFIGSVIEHITSLRTQRARPRNPHGYKLTVAADLLAREYEFILAQHHRFPTMSPDQIANYYEARPELHTGASA